MSIRTMRVDRPQSQSVEKGTDSLISLIHTPLVIRGRPVSNRLFLAPMAGLGHVAFRHLLSEFGGYGLLFTGMCSAKAVPHENPGVSPVFTWREAELPKLVCQIFGSDPAVMARAAERIEKEGFFGVDLNFGCSVAAICKQGSGAALLKTPEKAEQIVRQVRSAVSIPVFVKFRTGWKNCADTAVDLARRFEDAGADALVFHPRIAPDRRSRPPLWDHIRRVKQGVSLPVMGNGNLFSVSDVREMREKTGCDGFSIGRMAVARPWIFDHWSSGKTENPALYHWSAQRLARLLVRYHGEAVAIKQMKKYIPYLCAGFKFSHALAKALAAPADMTSMQATLERHLLPCPERASRPSLHLFC